MNSIISYLLLYNQFLISTINRLLLFIAKNIPLGNYRNNHFSPKYQKFTVDTVPIIKTFKRLDYKVLLSEYKSKNGKELKPVKSRGANVVPADALCLRCGGPHNYLYDNNGGRGQLLCKICNFRFKYGKDDFKTNTLICPYCGRALSRIKSRKFFNIHKCVNMKCSFYLDSLSRLSPDDLEEFKRAKYKFKLHYIYREFTIDFFKVDLSSMPKGSFSLSFRKFSPHVMGLCLTYHVNLGLSTRATARALWEVHGVKISHVTVSRYAKTASVIVKPFVDNFDYEPTNYLAADETYIKIKGITHYVWFVMDALKKSVLGYQVSNTRSIGPCILAMRMAFEKFKKFPGLKLNFISDGYSVYNLAKQQFFLNNEDFNLIQVIGLTNDDPISKKYRYLKQIIERLNRTFKFSYRVTNGYSSGEGSDAHVGLFVAYYNFLRPHTYSKWEPLNTIPQIEAVPNMPGKWQKLIELSQEHILTKQVS